MAAAGGKRSDSDVDLQGYVEMTGMDSDTSQDIAEAISLKGGRYLEAQIQVVWGWRKRNGDER